MSFANGLSSFLGAKWIGLGCHIMLLGEQNQCKYHLTQKCSSTCVSYSSFFGLWREWTMPWLRKHGLEENIWKMNLYWYTFHFICMFLLQELWKCVSLISSKKAKRELLHKNLVRVSKCGSEAGCTWWCTSEGLGVCIWACWRWQLATRDRD